MNSKSIFDPDQVLLKSKFIDIKYFHFLTEILLLNFSLKMTNTIWIRVFFIEMYQKARIEIN